MRLLIVVVSDNPDLRRFAGRSKDSLVPSDFRSGSNPLVNDVIAVSWNPATGSSADLAEFVLERALDVDGVLFLVGESRANLLSDFGSACHVVIIPDQGVGDSIQNFFQKHIAAGLRNFRRMSAMIGRGDDGKLLRLPIRNFSAKELQEIARVVLVRGGERQFADEIEKQMVSLRRRVRPRKRSEFKQTYIVDDDQKFFRYGQERHGSFSTGGTHTARCELQGRFRFGHPCDCERHYNVSKGEGDKTSISGNFTNCHDEVETFAATSHLNIFSNDNIR